MEQKIALITGANAGIGKAAAIALSKRGMHVVMLCRNKERGEAARREVEAQSGQAATLMLCDLASMADVKRFCDGFKSRFHKLDVLINNAGVIAARRKETKDGLEMDFGVNHIAHFLLTLNLMDRLLASENARIIMVGSAVHQLGKLDFTNLSYKKGFTPSGAYCRSKLCNLLFTRELAERLKNTSVTINCVHPGTVATNIVIKTDAGIGKVLMQMLSPVIKTPEQGAATIIYLASDEACAKTSGGYFSNCTKKQIKGPANDALLAKKLWDVCQDLAAEYLDAEPEALAEPGV